MLDERADPPFRKQILVEAILDVDDDGHLAGIEIIARLPGGKLIEPPEVRDATPKKRGTHKPRQPKMA